MNHYSCVFGKRNDRVLVRVSVCVCLFACLSVRCCTITQKEIDLRNLNWNSLYYENSSDEFDIELHRIKVKVTIGIQKFSKFTTMQSVKSYSSSFIQARNLILSMYVHLVLVYKIYECCHA